MITSVKIGDITDPGNSSDIIIGMNTEGGELSALGRRFLDTSTLGKFFTLGSVLTFEFDEDRYIHMVVCHHLWENGWKDAPRYLRYGLDTLWITGSERDYSIVSVGAGEVGQKYGADVGAIRAGIDASYLPVQLFLRPEKEFAKLVPAKPARFLKASSPVPKGGLEILTASA